MTSEYAWFVAAGLLVIAELAIGTFYLLMVALGLLVGGLGGLVGLAPGAQAIVSAVVVVAGIVVLRRSRFGRLRRRLAGTDPNTNLDIGQELDVAAWDAYGHARAAYRGADWSVQLAPDHVAAPGRFRIVEVRGTTLVVAPCAPPGEQAGAPS